MANRIPDNDDLRLAEQRRNIPSAPAVSTEGATIEPVAGPDITAGPTATPTQNLNPSAAQSLINTEEPIPFRPINYTLPSVPDFLAHQVPSDLEQAQQFNQSIGQLDQTNDIYSVGQLRNRLRSTFNINQRSSVLAPTDRGLPTEIDVSIEQANTRRALQTQNVSVAPNADRGLTGVTRSLQSGQPFTAASNQSVRDFFLDTLGVDVAVQQPEREEVEAPSLLDRVIASVTDVAGNAVFGGLGNFITPGAREVGGARRILQQAAQIANDRVQRRVDEVGLGQFVSENTLGRLTPGRTASNLARNLRRSYGTPSAALNSVINNTTVGFLGFEDGRIVQGSGEGAQFRNEIQGTDVSGVTAILRGAAGLPPEAREAALPTDSTFLGELHANSADFRNLLQDLQPVVNEAGQIGFNPFSGHFGEYGSAGSLSSLLWLANIPEGLLTGALYDITDLARTATYDTRVGRLLGRVSPIFNEPLPPDNARRLDLLGAVVGRDYGFTQRYSEDRYLSFIGNPGLRWVPRPVQIAGAFVADAAVGGFTDWILVDPVFTALQRGGRVAAREIVESATETAVETTARNIDRQIARSAREVLSTNELPQQTIERLSRNINRTVAEAPITDRARVLMPDLEQATRRFDLQSDASYSLSTAVRRGGEFEQLQIPFTRPRLRGEVTETTLEQVARRTFPSNRIGVFYDPVRTARRLRSLDEQVANIESLINAETARAASREVVAGAEETTEQLSLQLQDSYQQSLNNILDEQTTLLRSAPPEEVELYIQNLLNRDTIDVTSSGLIVQEAADPILDTLAPLIPQNQLTPRVAETTSELLYRYRIDPDQVLDLDVVLVRRTDETINEVARTWGLDDSTVLTSDEPIEELSSLYRLSSFAQDYPTLLGRYGKPVSANIDSPIKRVDFSAEIDEPFSLSAVVAPPVRAVSEEGAPTTRVLEPLAPEARREIEREARRRLSSLQTRAGRITSDIQRNLYEGKQDAVLGLEEQLQRVTAETNRLLADNPDIAVQQIVDVLPDNLRPVGAQSSALRDRYALGEYRFHYENNILRRMQADLSDVDSLVKQQQDVVARLPQLERYSPANELATRRREGLTSRTATGEMAQPGPELTIPELPELVRFGESVSELLEHEELAGFTEDQLRQAVRNSPALDFDDVDPNFIIPLGDEIAPDPRRFAAFEPLSRDSEFDVSVIAASDDYSLERVSRTISNETDIGVTVTFANDVDLELTRLDNKIEIGFEVDGNIARPSAAEGNVSRSLSLRNSFRDMKNYLDNFMRMNPNFEYIVSGIGGGTVISDELRSVLESGGELSERLQRQLIESVGEQYSKYRQYRKFGFRLLEGEDSQRILSLAEFARQREAGAIVMEFASDPADGLRTIRNSTFSSDYYHGTKAIDLDVPAHSSVNELGPGLYLSSDLNVARRHARATPSEDLIDVGTLTNRFTNQGRIFPVSIPNRRAVSSYSDIEFDNFNVLNIRTADDDILNIVSDAFSTTLEELLPQASSRWASWSRRHGDMAEWWHYIRSQFVRLRGVDSMDEYTEFASRVRQQMIDVGIDGLQDGDTLVVLNQAKTFTRPAIVDSTSTGSIAEGLLNRYAADLELHRRVSSTTSEAILETDRLAVDQYMRNQLANAVQQQENITVKATRAFNEVAERMEKSVDIDRANNVANTIDDSFRDAVNQSNRINRTVNNLPGTC